MIKTKILARIVDMNKLLQVKYAINIHSMELKALRLVNSKYIKKKSKLRYF